MNRPAATEPRDAHGLRGPGPAEFEMIRQLARRTFGLDLRPGKEHLVSSRLRQLMVNGGFQSFEEYYRHVIHDPTGNALTGMIDALATNHTAFLREPEHFEFLRRKVLPALASRAVVDIWCAACATGEEVWTLAFVLQECMLLGRSRITGSDISTKALQFASRGVYPDDRCQGLPRAWLTRYFTREPGAQQRYRVSAFLRNHASFQRINLVEPFPWKREFPVIFCRNVMIYFDLPTQELVVRQLAACLEPGGYLMVGHAETLTSVPHSLEYVQPAVYRKPVRSSRWR